MFHFFSKTMVTFSLSVKREIPKRGLSGLVFPKEALGGQSDLAPDAVLQGGAYANGLLSAIARAYSSHSKLVLRPDDIWHSILVHFGVYVNTHAEQMRQYLVKHQNKMQIDIAAGSKFDPSVKALSVPILKVREELKMHAQEVATWSEPHFSTTTEFDRLLTTVELMGAVKAYFGYKFCYDCGLSEVELRGEKKDWEMLLSKIDFIASIPELGVWANALRSVLSQFVAVWDGRVDEDFWQKICKVKSRGSGGEKTVSGWMLCFACFDKQGKYMTIADDKDILGMSFVDIEIDDNGNNWTMEAHAGSRTVAIHEDAYVPVNALYFIRKPTPTKEDQDNF
jgi:hypothetical protein